MISHIALFLFPSIPHPNRDGSPVELIGLAYSTISWLASLSEKGQYQFTGVYKTTDKSPGTSTGSGMSPTMSSNETMYMYIRILEQVLECVWCEAL